MANLYASLDRAKLELGISGTTYDTLILALIEAASRRVDMFCRRHFYSKTETRYFSPKISASIYIDDLLSLTELATDDDSDLDYDDVWTSGDYLLMPANGWPKWSIQVHPDGDYAFPLLTRGARVAGIWGYGDGTRATPWDSAGITGTVATVGGTTLTLSAAGLEAGQTIMVGTEQMYVSAVTDGETHTATVQRGVNGTTAAIQAAAAVSVAAYPEAAREAAIWLTGVAMARKGRGGLKSETIRGYSYQVAGPEETQGRLGELLAGLVNYQV